MEGLDQVQSVFVDIYLKITINKLMEKNSIHHVKIVFVKDINLYQQDLKNVVCGGKKFFIKILKI